MKILKTYETETAHIVRKAVSERCKYNIHGHSYRWEIEIEGPVNFAGMVMDFKELKPIKDFIDQFDHSVVFWEKENVTILQFFKANFKRMIVMKQNCTAENMARLVFKFTSEWLDSFPGLELKCSEVRVWETRTGCGIANESNDEDIIHYIQLGE